MKTSCYVCFDDISLHSGTKVFYHEIQALKKVSDLKLVVARGYPGSDVHFKKLDLFEQFYSFNPFHADYFASQLLEECQGVDFLHLACSPGQAILNVVRPKHYTTHIIAHNLKDSIDEHIKYYGSYNLPHNTDYYLHSLLLKHADSCDAVVTASNVAAKWIKENTKAKKVVPIPHGTEIPEITKDFPEKFTVGYMGVFGPDKGLPYLFAAWDHFMPENSELVFAGNCGNILQEPNFRKAFNLDSLKRTVIAGWIPEISDFYNDISVYCQPSVTEGFGIEIPEAMSYGRPVITTSTTGGADLITDGVDGFIVQPRNPNELLKKIQFLYDNPKVMKEMGQKAREKVKKFTWGYVQEAYKEFFLEAMGR